MARRFSRTVPLSFRGRHRDLRIEGTADPATYRWTLYYDTLGQFVTVSGTAAIDKTRTRQGGGVVEMVGNLAYNALTAAEEAAGADYIYIVAEGVPGFAQDQLRAPARHLATVVGYDMDHERGVPTTVWRVSAVNEAAVDTIVEAIQNIDTTDEGEGGWTIAVRTTRSALDALGSVYNANDLATRIAAENEETARENDPEYLLAYGPFDGLDQPSAVALWTTRGGKAAVAAQTVNGWRIGFYYDTEAVDVQQALEARNLLAVLMPAKSEG